MVNRITLTPLNGRASPITKTASSTAAQPFAAVLKRELGKTGEVRFSAHAQSRLESRKIALSSEELTKIDQAVEQAAAKGARESLLVMDRVALVVNVPNRTVITALATGETENSVFTNIDSAVVVPGSQAPPTLS